MPTIVKTEYRDGKRITTRHVHTPLAGIFAKIAVANAVPQIEHGDQPATEATINDLLSRGACSIVFLAMTVESAANQFGEDAFRDEFEDFERCRGRFAKPDKTMAEAVNKWRLLFEAKGRAVDFVKLVAPGLGKLFEARHALTHYKLTKHAEKWVAEEPITSDDCRVVFTAFDKFKRVERGIFAAFGASSIKAFYESVRDLFRLWYEVVGADRALVDELLPPVKLPKSSNRRKKPKKG